MSLVQGAPVLITGGNGTGRVGLVRGDSLGLLEVTADGIYYLKHRDELEPLVTISQAAEFFEIEERQEEEEESPPPIASKILSFGMSSEQLAEFVEGYIVECVGRIRGVGNAQYSQETHQKFEGMSIEELIGYLQEELMDISNYCAMLHIITERVRQALAVTEGEEE
ncbi:hypothetical protein [Saccharothrix sp. HUAS TT1]|uniref:hypothetical protein n=1 Tax=unclassified Saccharothrix TaxID=2593673 RepID=UPI00345C4C8B